MICGFSKRPASARFFAPAADSVLSSQDIILLRTYGGAAAWTKGKGPPYRAPCCMMRWNRGTMKLPYIKVEVEYREEETGGARESIAGAYRGIRAALGLGLSLHVQRAVHPLSRSGFNAAAAFRHLRRLPRRGVAAVRRVSETGPPTLRHAGAHPPQPCDRGVFGGLRDSFCAWRGTWSR